MTTKADRAGRWTIRSRLLLGLLAIVVLMTVDAGIIIRQQQAVERTLVQLERASTVERYLLQCRRQEKNYLLRRDAESLELFQANLNALLAVTDELLLDVTDTEVERRLRLLKTRIAEYRVAFERSRARAPLVAETEDQANDWPTVEAARDCHHVVGQIRDGTILRFHDAKNVTRTVSLVSVVLALVLSVLIAGMLTRSIVGPLERLRRLAERVGSGDIQDMDVELSDLDLGRFRSRECFDLARALQCMVTNMRFLVSTERGLMDEYHMTILVLVNKALGACRWAVVERARRAAGFDSFSEVDPSNVDRFLAELEKEAATLASEERVQLLIRAVRELEL